MVDIAARALSPGVNDPTTAVHALSHVSALLGDLAHRPLGPAVTRDEQGTTRLVVPQRTLESLVRLGLEEPVQYAEGSPAGAAPAGRLLRELAWRAPAGRLDATVRPGWTGGVRGGGPDRRPRPGRGAGVARGRRGRPRRSVATGVAGGRDRHGAHTRRVSPDDVVARLRAAGCVFAEEEAALLVADGRDLGVLVARRAAGEPLEQVLGWVAFGGLRVLLDPGVFVPRQRTGLLVEQAVALGGRVVVDLCCGAGAVGLAVAAGLGDVELVAADVDPVAVACARRNGVDARSATCSTPCRGTCAAGSTCSA